MAINKQEDIYLGERVSLRGDGKWWGGDQYEAHVVDIGTGDKAGTIKVQYADGGFKRFKKEQFDELLVAVGDSDAFSDFGSKDYEWADDQYNPANELDAELDHLRQKKQEAIKNKDFLAADKFKLQIMERQSHQHQVTALQKNLVVAAKRENFVQADKIQKEIATLLANKVVADKANGKENLTAMEIFEKAKAKAFRGGLAGMAAMTLQVCSLMWMRTTMNYQYRYGTTTRQALKALYKDGGIPRFYAGLAPALFQGPLSRFGDTAANVGMLTVLDANDSTKNLPIWAKTMGASLAAATFRSVIMPIDTVKTMMQVEGAKGIPKLRAKLQAGGPTVMWHGAIGASSATFAGHFPWFTTYNTLDAYLPKPVDTLGKLGRNALMGFCASFVSDCTSNSIRVLKTYRQTSEVKVSYMEAAQVIIKQDGVSGLFLRGLGTRLIANGIQGMAFSIGFKYFQEQMDMKF